MSEHYSPLRYPGGKAVLASFLVEVLRANGFHEPHYIEPYAGGAGAALRLLIEEYVESITINDADYRISAFWRAVTERNEQFAEMIFDAELNVEEWLRQRAIYEKASPRNFLRLGFATFYLNRTTRSGIVHNGGPIGGYDQSGNYKIDARFNREGLTQRVKRIGAYSDRIHVSNEDGIDLLRAIGSATISSREKFVYLDPPYYIKGAELYLNKFSNGDHAKLAEFLKSNPGFAWIMTYDYVDAILELYRGLNQSGFYLNYSAYKRRRGKEVLIWPDSISVPNEITSSLPVVA